MIRFLLGLLNPLGPLVDKIADAYVQRSNAQTERERVAADERIKTLEARRDVILQAQSDPMERWIRIGFAAPFVIYNAKLVLWDKVLGWGVTDPLGVELATIQSIVIAGYFIDAAVKRFTR